MKRPTIRLEGWGLSHMILSWLPVRGGRLDTEFNPMTNNSISHAYMTKPQYELETPKLDWVSWMVIHINIWGRWCILGTRKLCFGDPPRPYPIHFFIWPVLFCILCNKTVIINIALSWVLWVILVNYWTWEGSRKPWICSWGSKVQATWELQSGRLVSEMMGVLWKTETLTCEIWPNSR